MEGEGADLTEKKWDMYVDPTSGTSWWWCEATQEARVDPPEVELPPPEPPTTWSPESAAHISLPAPPPPFSPPVMPAPPPAAAPPAVFTGAGIYPAPEVRAPTPPAPPAPPAASTDAGPRPSEFPPPPLSPREASVPAPDVDGTAILRALHEHSTGVGEKVTALREENAKLRSLVQGMSGQLAWLQENFTASLALQNSMVHSQQQLQQTQQLLLQQVQQMQRAQMQMQMQMRPGGILQMQRQMPPQLAQAQAQMQMQQMKQMQQMPQMARPAEPIPSRSRYQTASATPEPRADVPILNADAPCGRQSPEEVKEEAAGATRRRTKLLNRGITSGSADSGDQPRSPRDGAEQNAPSFSYRVSESDTSACV